jgi:hypothetical protein
MRVMPVGNAADRVPQDLDRRLGYVLVVVRRARLAKVFKDPRLIFARFDLRLWLDTAKPHSSLNRALGRDPPPRKTGASGSGFWGMMLLMCTNDSVHWPMKRLARLNSAIEDPAPWRLLLDFSVR